MTDLWFPAVALVCIGMIIGIGLVVLLGPLDKGDNNE
jgi:hypothetical protein